MHMSQSVDSHFGWMRSIVATHLQLQSVIAIAILISFREARASENVGLPESSRVAQNERPEQWGLREVSLPGPTEGNPFDRLLAALGGRAMIQFSVGGGVRLHLNGGPWHVVTIESEFRTQHQKKRGAVSRSRSLPLIGCFGYWMRELVSATIGQDGALDLDFGDARITVPVDENFEAWQVSADDGFLIVSMPGGELSYWTPSPSAYVPFCAARARAGGSPTGRRLSPSQG